MAAVAIVMHHINSYHCSMHGVASSSVKCELTNGCAPSRTSGCLRFPKSILTLLALLGCYFSFSCGGVNHMTLMPCRNLGPHVRCSHMIEPQGARWCLGICDVTHFSPLFMQPC